MSTDPVQLQQKIIHFQSELKKYQDIVKDYENNYHFAQFKKLKEENELLKAQMEEQQNEFERKIEEIEKQYSMNSESSSNDTTTEEAFQQLIEEKEKVENELLQTREILINERKQFERVITQLKKEKTDLKNKLNALELNNDSLINSLDNEELIENITPILENKHSVESSLSETELKILHELDNQFRDLFNQSFPDEKLLDPKNFLIQQLEKKIEKLTQEIIELEASKDNNNEQSF